MKLNFSICYKLVGTWFFCLASSLFVPSAANQSSAIEFL
jgi:hypothetical protein